MMYGMDALRKSREDYVQQIMERTENRGKKLYLYGAGSVGAGLCSFLERHGISPDAFCVTEMQFNAKERAGIPVMTIDEVVAHGRDAVFVIAALEPVNKAMIAELEKRNISDYIDIPKNMPHLVDEVCLRPTLEITSRVGCSVHCKFCPQDKFIGLYTRKSRPMLTTFDLFKTCIDKTPKDMIVDFAGFAEPFLNPDIVRMMQYAASIGKDMRLFTTLVGLNEEKLDAVLALPFRYVVLHLPDKYDYSNIPRTNEYFLLLQRMLRAKKQDGTPFVDKANSQAELHPDVLPYLRHELGNELTASGRLIDWAGNLSEDELLHSPEKHGEIICNYAVNQNHNILLPDGTVLLCCMDWGMTCVLGNLVENSYEDIVNGEIIQKIRKNMCTDLGEFFICRKCTDAIEI